jgi:hypothetical protein
MKANQEITKQYLNHISSQEFPCIGAKASVTKFQTDVIVAENICCPNDDIEILHFLYDFIDKLRNEESLFQSASILFKGPNNLSEEDFEKFLWMRLQSIADLDAINYAYANKVSQNPKAVDFCYSVKEEAFFILALHAESSRKSRKFEYPVIVFNSQQQFEKLKESGAYNKMQGIIRKRDIDYSGSINPMLSNFGERSSAFQISGKKHDSNWDCPFKSNYK